MRVVNEGRVTRMSPHAGSVGSVGFWSDDLFRASQFVASPENTTGWLA
jgi:hypothetical protein